MTKPNPGRKPNKTLVTQSVGAFDGSEPLKPGGSSITGSQPQTDHGKGKTAPPASNNDVSYSPAPK
jgi:hypothetical protein